MCYFEIAFIGGMSVLTVIITISKIKLSQKQYQRSKQFMEDAAKKLEDDIAATLSKKAGMDAQMDKFQEDYHNYLTQRPSPLNRPDSERTES